MVHCHTECKNVRSRIGLPAVLLGRSIALCAEHCRVRKVLFLIFSGNTEVNYLDIALGLQHNIRRLHITVNNRRFLRMQIRKCVAQLLCPVYNKLLRLRSVFIKYLIKRLALDIVHHDINRHTVVDNIYNSGQGRMIKLFHHICFGKQAVDDDLVILSAAFFADFLNSPLLVQVFVHCEVNNRHTAATDFFQYFIFTVDYGSYLSHMPTPHSALIRRTDILSFSSLFLTCSIRYFALLCMASLFIRLIGLSDSYISASLIS